MLGGTCTAYIRLHMQYTTCLFHMDLNRSAGYSGVYDVLYKSKDICLDLMHAFEGDLVQQ